jgi:hypothetical protein
LGDLLYSEDFSDPSTGWDQFTDVGMYLAYEDGQYQVKVDSPNWMTWGNAYQWFENGIIIRVKATKLGGPDDNCYGVLFGYQDSDNFYRFEISSDGFYRFGKYLDDEWIPIIPWTESDLILQGYETNRIRVEMRDGQFVFAVNGEPLAWAQDDSFSDGDVGLVAGSFDIPGVRIAFDDLEVYAAAGDAAELPAQPADGEILFADDFQDAESGWDVFSGDDQTVGYEDGQYVLRVNKVNWMTWGNAYQRFEDGVLVEVDATKLDGPDDNSYGLVFGYQDEGNFYRFEISSDGYYRFGKHVDNEWIEVIPWTTSDLIVQGEATNRMSAAMRGGRLAFAVNGEVLTATEDDSFADGDVGLVAGSFDEAGVVIGFDDFVVYAMP